MIPTTTSALIRQIRSQLKEKNTNSVSDQEIMDAINRGQMHSVEILTRNYVYPYLEILEISTGDDGLFSLPEDIMSNRIVNIECDTSSTQVNNINLTKLNYKDRSRFRGNNLFYSQYPQYYFVNGKDGELYPPRASSIFIYYIKEPEAIVSDAGQISDIVSKNLIARTNSGVSAASLTLALGGTAVLGFADETEASTALASLEAFLVDNPVIDYEYEDSNGLSRILRITGASFSQDLANIDLNGSYSISYDEGQSFNPITISISSTDILEIFSSSVGEEVLDYIVVSGFDNSIIDPSNSNEYASYVNICDAQTGLVESSFQASPSSEEDGSSYILRPRTPVRTSVLNRSIDNLVDIPITEIEFQVDDYLSGVRGTCVLQFDTAIENFIIQYAVTEIKRSLNHEVQIESQVLSEFETMVKRTYVNHDNSMRVQNNSYKWSRGRWRLNRR